MYFIKLDEMWQVDLKLKVCRGSSARKILVREAKSNSAAMLIVGTSKTHHKIRSSTSVAKYCARNLSKKFSVIAVTNGKIMFQRETTPTALNPLQGLIVCLLDMNLHEQFDFLIYLV